MKFQVGDIVEISGIIGTVDGIVEYLDRTFGYIVVSNTNLWLENHVIVEEALNHIQPSPLVTK